MVVSLKKNVEENVKSFVKNLRVLDLNKNLIYLLLKLFILSLSFFINKNYNFS